MKATTAATLFASLATIECSLAKIYFQESFGEGWEDRWVIPSKWKEADEMGEWKWTAGKWYGKSGAEDKGIQTSQDSRFYGLSAPLDEAFTNDGKDMVLQFSVKNENKVTCAGAYIKLLGGGTELDQDSFGGDTPYQIMFGPDMCGPTNARTHVIFNYPPKDDNLLINTDVKVEKDELTHLYTLHVKADGSFEVLIDQQSVRSGTLEADFDFLPPKELKDPDQSKPEDWVDEQRIPDPEDKKPEGFDDIPEFLPDASAVKPSDWEDESDGEWEAPPVRNPDYQGEWRPKMIDNPDYKGPWEHPMIPNPDYTPDPALATRCDKCTHVGFELWQVSAGSLFDDIIVTDSLEEARAFAEKTFSPKVEGEKEMQEEVKEAEEEEKKKKREEEAAAAAAAEGDEEEKVDLDGEDEDDEHEEL